MADNLFAQAGQNFQAAGETAIRSQEADTQRKNVEQQPGLLATKEVGDTMRTAMGDKSRLKEIQEQASVNLQSDLIKHKMGMVKFPPALAIFYSKKFKQPELLQLAGQEMPVELSHAIIDKMGNQQRSQYPKFAGNMMITLDEDGNEVMKNMEDMGFHYRPTGTGKGGRGTGEDPKDKEFLKTYRQYQKETEGMNYMLLGQLAKKDPKQAKDIEGKLKFLEKNTDRFNKLQGVQGNADESGDTGGAGAGAGAGATGGGDNQKATDWLKKNYPNLQNPSPEDIQWAIGKMNG